MKETDLFGPVSDYLSKQGYEVSAEVKDCDLVATRDDDLIIVELKTSANMTLLIQAIKRQRISDSVYVAIPDPGRTRHARGIHRVLRRLELGLLLVRDSTLGPVVVRVFDPLPAQRQKSGKTRRAVIQEIADRSGNYNTGGSTRTPIVTAYRETAIYIAVCLGELGPSSPRSLRALGAGDKTGSILAHNHYGWFQRLGHGLYGLTDAGARDLDQFPEVKALSLEVYRTRQQET